MHFTKRLRDPIMRGDVTCTIRIWQSPRVKVGGRYKLEHGFVRVTKIRPIGLSAITPELARRSGFLGVVDLLKIARHGSGENVYLIDFVFEGPDALNAPRPSSPRRGPRRSTAR